MGLFGSSGVDSSGSSGEDYASKNRTPSYSTESDFGAGGGALNSLDLAGGDFEKGLQIEQQKATLMTQVHIIFFVFCDCSKLKGHI